MSEETPEVDATFPPADEQQISITEQYFLSKFDGDSTDPMDEVERIEFNAELEVVAIHTIENGEIVETVHVPTA